MRVLAAILLALAAPVRAADAAPPELTRALLDVRVNGAPHGEALVLLGADGDAWMSPRDLEATGLRGFAGTRRMARDAEVVSLRSLASRLAFAVDERALRIDLTAGPELLGRDRVDFGATRPAGVLEGGDRTGFLNYAVQATLDGRASGYGELGLSTGAALLSSGFSAPWGQGIVRGLSSVTLDSTRRLERWTLGDAPASLGGLGSSGVVAGVSFTREFSLDPYVVQAPRPATSAFAASPSTLEVYVNGVLVRRQAVGPGTLDLTNLPVVAGTSDVRAVLRDAYGRERAYDLRATFSPGLLAHGRSDFAYHAGLLRDGLATSFDYGGPVLLARHRVGVSDVVTVGGRAEAALARAMAGPTLTLGTPFGQVDAELAGSVDRGRSGGAATAALSWPGRSAGLGVRVRGLTRSYATAVLERAGDRALLDAAAYASASVLRSLSIGVEASASRWRDQGPTAAIATRAELAVGSGVTVLASVGNTFGGASPGVEATLALAWSVGHGATAQAGGAVGARGPAAGVSVQRALPRGPGFGYRVDALAGRSNDRGSTVLQAQSGAGRVEAQVTRTPDGGTAALTVSGAAVLAGGRAFLSRPVEDSFALVRVGVPGVRGYLENQEVGRTDGRGDLLVPGLQPRYANRLAIRASDVPAGYDVKSTEALVAPPRKGGSVARLEVVAIRAVVGRLVLAGTAATPIARGEVTVRREGGTDVSPTTSDGRFFFERLPAGRYEAEAVWAEGTCRFTFVVPDAPGLHDLGTVGCTREQWTNGPRSEPVPGPR